MSKSTTDSQAQPPERFGSDLVDDVLQEISSLEEVTINRATDAVVCGAAGCRTGSNLLRAVIDDVGSRVLCQKHTVALVQREVIEA